MKHVGARIVLSVAVLTALAFVHPFGDPRVEPAKGLDTLLPQGKMSAEARRVLVTKCADCHSNETRWPLYARVAPGSWLIERDIVAARRKMNLSMWEQMPTETQDVWIGQIIHEAKTGEMPPPQYRLLHWGAKLTVEEVATLATMQHGVEANTGAGPGDAARGKNVFEKRCTGCHAMDADREGPRLGGVFGRKLGSVHGFDYSAGLKNLGGTWDEARLDRWLSDPDRMVPNNKMDSYVPKVQERADLIAYFKQGTQESEKYSSGAAAGSDRVK